MSLPSRVLQLEKTRCPAVPLGVILIPAERRSEREAAFIAREKTRLEALGGIGGFVVLPAKGSI